MFKQIGTGILKSTHICSLKQVIRCKRNAVKKLTLNPGIQHQMKLLKESDQDEFDFNEIESVESDFMNLGSAHENHLKELQKFKDREKVFIVKQKYFKEKFPNFLTWNDKEQIQYLHRTNPEEWTIEKLSDGFPALPDTIKKIVRSNWSKSASKIQNHDNSVKRNWELFNNGHLNLSRTLTEHLHKFTNRNSNVSQNIINKKDMKKLVPKTNGEFSEIIKSYQCLETKNKSIDKDEAPHCLDTVNDQNNSKEETYLLNKDVPQNNKNVTLEYLKDSIMQNVHLGKDLDEDDKVLLTEINTRSTIEDSKLENHIVDIMEVSKTAYVSTNIKTEKDLSYLKYPEKIVIPKNKLKHGYTYKLNDCYYDSDGLFLYRVPGMEK